VSPDRNVDFCGSKQPDGKNVLVQDPAAAPVPPSSVTLRGEAALALAHWVMASYPREDLTEEEGGFPSTEPGGTHSPEDGGAPRGVAPSGSVSAPD
jgi:hypothetical protein